MSQSKIPGCKVVLLGESGVGKSCIISRYIQGTFDQNCASTNGASYASKIVKYDTLGKQLSLDIWDTAGQEKYRALTKFFYKDAMVVILVYDITRADSFKALKDYWYKQVIEHGEKKIILGIAGNKSDLYENEEVNETEARNFANEIGAIFKLTSASENIGIEELFYEAGGKHLDPNFGAGSANNTGGPKQTGSAGKQDNDNGNRAGVKLDPKLASKKKKGGCC